MNLTIITIMAFIIGGLVLCWAILVWGISAASVLLLPFLKAFSALFILLFLLGVLPLSLIKRFRPRLAMASLVMSQIIGATAWMLSFLYLAGIAGSFGLFLFLFFHFLAPIAWIAAIFKSDWQTAGELTILISFTYAMKYYSMWLIQQFTPKTRRSEDVIDVEGRVVD